MAVTCVDQMLLWYVKAFLVIDAVRACLYVVMAIFSAVRARIVAAVSPEVCEKWSSWNRLST